MVRPSRRYAALAGLVALGLALVALPTLAASPSPSPGKSGAAKPEKSHAPEKSVTLHGAVSAGKDDQGRPTYSLAVGGTTYDLSDGPPWFWGDKNPLAAYVGQTVDVVGQQEEGSSEVDVDTVNGKALRDPGKPPWAGGPKAVGAAHPGYNAWKAAHDKTGGPPGQQKDKTGADDTNEAGPSATP
jgi:hypothetical protein